MKKHNKHGFTLIELIIVIAILAVVAAIAIPTLSGLISKAQKSACAENMSNLMRSYLAERTLNDDMESIKTDAELTSTLDTASQKYMSHTLNNICPSGGKYTVKFLNGTKEFKITCSKHPDESITGNRYVTPSSLGKAMQEIFGIGGKGTSGTFTESKNASGFDSEAGAGSFTEKAKQILKGQGFADIDDYMWYYKKATGTFYIAKRSDITPSTTSVTVKKYMSDGTTTEEVSPIKSYYNKDINSTYSVLWPYGRSN